MFTFHTKKMRKIPIYRSQTLLHLNKWNQVVKPHFFKNSPKRFGQIFPNKVIVFFSQHAGSSGCNVYDKVQFKINFYVR